MDMLVVEVVAVLVLEGWVDDEEVTNGVV